MWSNSSIFMIHVLVFAPCLAVSTLVLFFVRHEISDGKNRRKYYAEILQEDYERNRIEPFPILSCKEKQKMHNWKSEGF